MFIRRKDNRSRTISVVVVDKSGGRFMEVHQGEGRICHPMSKKSTSAISHVDATFRQKR